MRVRIQGSQTSVSLNSRLESNKEPQPGARDRGCGDGAADLNPIAGLYLRLIDSCITQLKALGRSRTCHESQEEEEATILSPKPEQAYVTEIAATGQPISTQPR